MASSSTLLAPTSSLHHVFPSFHGADVRKTILSHIVKEFRSKGIDLFIDNNIERSKSIGPKLIEAIRGSRVAIVLLSQNYPSSTWCLNELVEIIKCREEFGQTVIVLFYEVDPTHVKKQTGYFGKVFRTTCRGKTEEEILRWKHALMEVAQIAGYHSEIWETEADMIEAIATDVSDKLNSSAPSSDFDGLVGMESLMKKMGPLLRLDLDEVRKIGILGPPGIGKTTIARSLFNRHSQDFQLSVFMDNIKRKHAIMSCSDDYSVKLDLQKQFMSQLTNETGIKIPHLGVAKDRLKNKKVLVVLDDVDRPVQLEAMANNTCWFGSGSRIVITTQDEKVLKSSGINHIYRVNLPPNDEALQMFCMYAFDQKYPKNGFEDLAWKVRNLVGRLPLGLRVMGSYFRGMSEQDWTKALPKLRTHLDRDGETASILKFCYDSLCHEDRRLFLHIACFFKGEPVDIVEGCLAECILDVTQGIHVLTEKSLISIDMDWGTIQMDTLLVQLGKQIVREQSVNKPGKRQFLNDARDIGEGSSSAIGIHLNEGIPCTSERAFERLSNLQFLKISGNCINPKSMNYISRKLRVLIWWAFQMSCFPSSFNPEFLVQLDMQYSKLEKLWEEIKPLSNLKWMNLSNSRSLEELPDLSTATNLYDLNLAYCSSLVKLPSSIGNTINLRYLNLSHCSSLVEIPSSIGNAVNLKELHLSYCSSLVELPSSIWNLHNLQKLNLSHCSNLVEIPSFITTITDLKSLDLSECSSRLELPVNIETVANPMWIDFSHCSSLVHLPSAIGNVTNLQKLDLGRCSSLVELPSSIGNAINLQELDLSHCTSLVGLPSSIWHAINLQELDLSRCSSLVELPSSIEKATNLQILNLSRCSSLVKLPSFIGKAAFSLQELDLSHCSSLVELPSSMKKLKLSKLELKGCSKLEVNLDNINLVSLQELDLSHCSLLKCYTESTTDIQELDPWIGRISCLRRLVLWGMKKLVSLPWLPYSIVELDASYCESLESLDGSFRNPDFRLNFANCCKLNQEARDIIIHTRTNEYAVFPAEEVPQCFTYRSPGSSVTVKLNQMPLGISTKFKACIIFAYDDENKFELWESASVCCTIIRSGGNASIACNKRVERVLPGNLCTFEVEVETEDVTPTELIFDFQVITSDSKTLKIKECGILQLLEIPLSSSKDVVKDFEPSDIESLKDDNEPSESSGYDNDSSDIESFGDGGKSFKPSDIENFGDGDEPSNKKSSGDSYEGYKIPNKKSSGGSDEGYETADNESLEDSDEDYETEDYETADNESLEDSNEDYETADNESLEDSDEDYEPSDNERLRLSA